MRLICRNRIHTDIRPLVLAVLVFLAQPSGNAVAGDLLGFYVGGTIGQSELRGDLNSFNCGFSSCSGIPSPSFARHATGWEVMAGIRPLPFLGAEAAYIDFGSSGTTSVAINSTATFPGILVSGTTHPTATALFAVGYLPVPLPYLDVFAKVGVAELRSNINFTGNLGYCAAPVCDPITGVQSPHSGTNTRPAYGAGLQMKLGSFAVRAAYDRISANTGDPSLLSLGLSWGF
jgi:Outer membrane protein beta-barrel domain